MGFGMPTKVMVPVARKSQPGESVPRKPQPERVDMEQDFRDDLLRMDVDPSNNAPIDISLMSFLRFANFIYSDLDILAKREYIDDSAVATNEDEVRGIHAFAY